MALTLTNRWWRISSLVVASLSVFACGDVQPTAIDPSAPPAIRAITVVGCDSGLRLEFVGDLDPKTVTSKAFLVERAPGVTAYDLAGRAVTFVPDEPFKSGQEYSAVLSGDVASIGGTRLGASMRWTFLCFDQSPPVVMERFPQGEGVSLLVRPTVRFNKPVDEKTLTPENLMIDGHPVTVTYSAAERTATLSPTYPLYPGRKYTVTVSPRVQDLSGNELGITVTWTFRTRAAGDDWAVRLMSPPVPSHAPCSTAIELRLANSFAVNEGSLNAPPIAIDGFPSLNTSYDSARRVIRIEPLDVPFRPGLTYQLLATGNLRDLSGDSPFDVGAVVGSFSVVPSCDVPTVAEVPSALGATVCDEGVTLTFSTPMDVESVLGALKLQDLTAGGFDLQRSPVVAASVTGSEDGYSATVWPEAPLVHSHRYWLSVSETAQSLDARSLASAGGWEFVASCP